MKGEFNSVILYDFASPSPLGTFGCLEMFLVILTVGSHKGIYRMLPNNVTVHRTAPDSEELFSS